MDEPNGVIYNEEQYNRIIEFCPTNLQVYYYIGKHQISYY